jgi:uncharacterized membrane protein
MEHLTEVGVGGIFVLLLLQVLMPHIVKMAKNGGGGSKSGAAASAKLEACETAEQRLEDIQSQMATLASSTQQMAVILTQTDPDGAPLVYGSPGRLTAAITSLGNTIDKLAIKIDHIQS